MHKNDQVTQWVYDFGDTLYRWAYHKTGDKETARDLVQETFLAAVKSERKFAHKSTPKTWLFGIMNNKIIDHYRSRSRKGRATEPLDEENADRITRSFFDGAGNWAESTSTTEWDAEPHLLDDTAFLEVMQQCLDDLPSVWQTAISAKYLVGKTATRICKELNITTTNYWQIIHRAKLLLKQCIETNWEA